MLLCVMDVSVDQTACPEVPGGQQVKVNLSQLILAVCEVGADGPQGPHTSALNSCLFSKSLCAIPRLMNGLLKKSVVLLLKVLVNPHICHSVTVYTMLKNMLKG